MAEERKAKSPTKSYQRAENAHLGMDSELKSRIHSLTPQSRLHGINDCSEHRTLGFESGRKHGLTLSFLLVNNHLFLLSVRSYDRCLA